MEKQQSGFVRFLVGLAAFILSFALFISLLGTIMLVDVRTLFDQNNLESLISGILMPSAAPARPVGAPMTGMEKRMQFSQGYDQEETESLLIEWVYELMVEELGGEAEVTVDQVKDFVKESTLEEFVSEKCAGIISDFINGESTVTLDADELMEQLELNKELIEETFDVKITDEIMDALHETLEENEVLTMIEKEGLEGVIMEAMGTDPESKEALDTFRDAMQIVRQTLSMETVMMAVGVCAVLAGLLFLLRWKRFWIAMRNVGWPMFWAGLIYLLPTVALISSRSMLLDVTEGNVLVVDTIIRITKMMLPVCAGVTGVGLALVIAGYVIGGVKANANRQKIQTVSAVPVPAYVEQVAQIQPTVSPWQREANQDTATEETQ